MFNIILIISNNENEQVKLTCQTLNPNRVVSQTSLFEILSTELAGFVLIKPLLQLCGDGFFIN